MKYTNSPEYYAWQGMKSRCYNPNYYLYHRYGGRGIKVCKRWLNSFESFLADVGKRPSGKHSLDRYPNNDGDYEPGNVRWATVKQQQQNRSTNKILYYNGASRPQVEWARYMNIDVRALHALLKRHSFESVMKVYEKFGAIDRRKAPFNKMFYKKREGYWKGKRGQDHPNSVPIYQLNKKTGEVISKYASIRQAALELKINNIDKALRDASKSAGGFKWRYA